MTDSSGTTDQDGDKTQEFDRRGFRAPVLILQVKLEEDRKVFLGYAKNISRGGLFIASTNPREPESTFKVEFTLPENGNHTINCTARVVWKRDYSPSKTYEPGMGLQFIDLGEEDGKLIKEWVDKTQLA